MLDFIVYGTFIVLFLSSFATNIILYIKRSKLQQEHVTLLLEKYTLSKNLEKLVFENESKKLEKDNGFLRFVSESRDWAFGYIEEVQNAIKAYSLDKNEKTYQALLDLLPDESNKENK